MNIDPLDKIFSSVEELDNEKREILAEILSPLVRIDPEKGIIQTKNPWKSLNAKQKILSYLLAKLALSTKNQNFKNISSPVEIENKTELPGGTVRPNLRSLVHDRITYQDEDGNYSVKATTISINKAKTLFEEIIQKNIKS